MSGARDGASTPYDLGPSFPVTEARNQRPGTTLLVTGPASTAERAVFRLLLTGHGADEGVVPVSTDRPPADLRSEYTDLTGQEPDDRLAVIDVTGESADATAPDDLAALGRQLTEAIERVDAPRVRVGVISLTGMLAHLDRTDVFKFCHVIRDRIDEAGFLGIATLDTDGVPEGTVSMLQEAFDGTVEVREDEKGELVRVVGLPDTPVTWHAWG
jgi:KaiC/GvpD/RAD55 family RecA-like ATPase